jgi:hypothetical protein|tara:strand:+ start:652 stop:987 length:336 start_codon:yes stop_codon:yes gene_type:complete
MKVNIQYSIDLEEIPGKVREFITQASEDSISIQAGLKYVISMIDSNVSIDEQMNQIDKVRRQMANIDLTLLDSFEILHGYQKALVQLRESNKPIEGSYNDDETRSEETEEG